MTPENIMTDKTLRSKVIKLAHDKPELQPVLLPLVTKKAGTGIRHYKDGDTVKVHRGLGNSSIGHGTVQSARLLFTPYGRDLHTYFYTILLDDGSVEKDVDIHTLLGKPVPKSRDSFSTMMSKIRSAVKKHTGVVLKGSTGRSVRRSMEVKNYGLADAEEIFEALRKTKGFTVKSSFRPSSDTSSLGVLQFRFQESLNYDAEFTIDVEGYEGNLDKIYINKKAVKR